MQQKVKIFVSYAHEDDVFRQQLDNQLSSLKQQDCIEVWHDRNISAGRDWKQEIDVHLSDAHIILLLVSAHFFASEYCSSMEVKQALEKHKTGETRVIPIILRPVDWRGAPFSHLQALPTGAIPVTRWSNRDEAFADIAQGIRRVVEELVQPNKDGPFIFSTERVRLVDLYLRSVIAKTKPLPWGYLPGDFTSELEVDDVYILPRLSSKEYRSVSIKDEWLEREIIRQGNQNQEKGKNKHRSVLRAEKPSYSSLYEIVQSGANAMLLGYMGSGKSMAANYIALRLAKGEGQSIFGLPKSKIPILLRLGRMRETPASDLITFAIEDAVTNGDHANVLKDVLRQEWNAGNVLLILDALDEFPQGELQWISNQIVQLSARDLNKNSVLLTSRPYVYGLVSTVGLKAFTLEELQREEICGFIEKWTNAFCKVTRIDIQARNHATSLTEDIEKHPLVQEIASNQLLLTLLTILSLRPGGIRLDRVKTEAQVLNAYVNDVIKRERDKGVEAPEKYGTDLLRIVFAYTGFEVQRAQSGMSGGICTYSSLLRMLSTSKYLSSFGNPGVTAEAILRFWLDTGLIQQTDDAVRSICFRHQAFQYLGAALTMTYQSEERVGKMLADVKTHPEWAYVRRLYFGLKSHPQSPLE